MNKTQTKSNATVCNKQFLNFSKLKHLGATLRNGKKFRDEIRECRVLETLLKSSTFQEAEYRDVILTAVLHGCKRCLLP